MKKAFFIFLSISASVIGCKKDKGPGKQGITEVYVAGSDFEMMALWNNNKQLLFEEQGNYGWIGSTYGITVKDTSVYVAGISTYDAVYYKDGVQTKLADGSEHPAYAYSIFFSGNDMYVAGSKRKAVNGFQVVEVGYWKNGVFNPLQEHPIAECYDVTVVGGKVHAVGYMDNVAVYWNDGDSTVLTRDFFSSANAIKAIGNDIYIAGNGDGKGIYWKNGVRNELEGDYTFAADIDVSGTDVYVAGTVTNDTKPFAAYWKNGKKFEFERGYATGIQILDGDVYISGYVDIENIPTAVYWKNGVRNIAGVSSSPGLPVKTTGIGIVKK